jgi:integrase
MALAATHVAILSGYHGQWSFLGANPMTKIRVHVVSYRDCKNLVLRYIDPVTGKPVRSTKYKDPQTGITTETGQNRKFAKKLAAQWEADLNAGRDQGRYATTWQVFRDRYEDEVIPGLADRTADKIGTVLRAVEKALPRVAGGKLAELNAEAVSRFQAVLRDGKRSDNTIAGYLAHLRAALAWAHDQGMIPSVPKIKRPQRAKKGGRGRKAKGRPITAEEFDRLISKIPLALADWRKRKREAARKTARNKGKTPRETQTDSIPVEVSPTTVESWRHYLTGLWLSGLRLKESLDFHWDRSDRLSVELGGKRPMLRVIAEFEKGHRDRLLPITPDLAQWLLRTPELQRRGVVFRPLMPSGNAATYEQAGRMLAIIGELARVVVHTEPRTGKVKFATAHTLRASFGTRWAKKVMPAVLQKLMRHESIETTMGYYVDLDADELAEDLYRKHDQGQTGTVLGTVGDSEGQPAAAPSALTRISVDG